MLLTRALCLRQHKDNKDGGIKEKGRRVGEAEDQGRN